MWNRLSAGLFATALCFGLAVMPTQAAESRVREIAMTCDGSPQKIAFNATALGASVTRLIQGGAVAIREPRGGIESLRIQLAGDPNHTVLVMGFGETSARADLTGFLQSSTTAGGVVQLDILGSCTGGGTLKGTAVVFFF